MQAYYLFSFNLLAETASECGILQQYANLSAFSQVHPSASDIAGKIFKHLFWAPGV